MKSDYTELSADTPSIITSRSLLRFMDFGPELHVLWHYFKRVGLLEKVKKT